VLDTTWHDIHLSRPPHDVAAARLDGQFAVGERTV
jgi:hypothetical protein